MVMATVLGFIFAVLEIKNHMKARLKRLKRVSNATRATEPKRYTHPREFAPGPVHGSLITI
jgi:hypothetical protein